MWKTVYPRDLRNSSEFPSGPGQVGVRSSESQKTNKAKPRTTSSQFFSKRSGKAFYHFSLLTFQCTILLVLVSGCSATYHAYCKDIRHGREALKYNDYGAARRNFEEAYQNGKSLDAIMYMAIIDYKTNNLDSAERLIREAEIMGVGNYHYLRVLGYKALILLKKNRDQGLEALDRYVVFYSRIDPLMSISEVKAMVQTGDIDMALLNKLIEEQVTWYESDVEQYWSTGTGWYADKWGGLAPIPGPPLCNP
jgi:hypothetical protein